MSASDDGPNQLHLGACVFDLDTGCLLNKQGDLLGLRKKSLSVLTILAGRNGETVSKEELIERVWMGMAVSDDNLVQCIKDIRAILDDPDHRLLRTAIGTGYSLHGWRDAAFGQGRRPKVLISAFRVSDQSPQLRDLADVITEDLIIALSPRTGMHVTTDNRQRATADYLIQGRVTRSAGVLRVFMQLLSGSSGNVAFAETWTCPTAEARDLPLRIDTRFVN